MRTMTLHTRALDAASTWRRSKQSRGRPPHADAGSKLRKRSRCRRVPPGLPRLMALALVALAGDALLLAIVRPAAFSELGAFIEAAPLALLNFVLLFAACCVAVRKRK